MALFTLYMYQQVEKYEGKGGCVVFADGQGTYFAEADRDKISGGGLTVEVPPAGMTLDPFPVWEAREREAFYAAGQAQRQASFDKLVAGTYNAPPEPVVMVSAFDPMTRTWGERPEDQGEKDARLKREEGDAAIQHGHITHDELTPAEVDKLSVEEYRAWKKTHPDR